jgi:hypothetical protein
MFLVPENKQGRNQKAKEGCSAVVLLAKVKKIKQQVKRERTMFTWVGSPFDR